MKTLHEQYLDIIRQWQAGAKTPELAKIFEDISANLVDSQATTFDDDVYETVHEINNFINTQRFLNSV